MPWVHTHIDTDGLVKACCNANITFGNINEDKLEDIWNGEPIKKFRKLMIAGEQDRRCASCFRKEAAGKSSMRMETLHKFQDKIEWVSQTQDSGYTENSKPIYFDIRFNNLCNLRCRTCWHGASSSWYEEAKILKTNVGDRAIISAAKDSEALLDELLAHALEIEEIYFAGGEPLMMKEHYDMLDRLITLGNTNVHLRYNTNLSMLELKNRKVLKYWPKFDQVTVSASIDGLGARGEYIRKGLKWHVFLSHMQIIKTEVPHVKLEIAPTISVFNVLTLAEFHRYFVDEGLITIDSIYLNMLSRPNYYNIKALPNDLKRNVESQIGSHLLWLKKLNASQSTLDEFESIIKFMYMDNWHGQLKALIKNTERLDNIRSENFLEVFPELTSIRSPV